MSQPESPSLRLLRGLLRKHTSAHQEQEILELFRAADTHTLNQMLADQELTRRLLGAVDDRLVGPDNRTALLDLLQDRIGELGLSARAVVIHALAAGLTARRAERFITSVILATTGAELTELKNRIDAFSDVNDLEALVYSEIDAHALRQQILDHISAQAGPRTGEVKILSDIDDTTLCALHDTRFPKGIIYPGALALWEALDAGPTSQLGSHRDLTFLTARPDDLLGVVERNTRNSLAKLGVGMNAVLAGGFRSLLSKTAMAANKMENIRHYRALFPEYDLVFIGDSGQGDLLVAEQLNQCYPDVARCTLIHDVVATPAEQRAAFASRRVVFFDTYVGAAQIVFHAGLISRDGLDKVVMATREGFNQVAWQDGAQEQHARNLLAKDLAQLAKDLAKLEGDAVNLSAAKRGIEDYQ